LGIYDSWKRKRVVSILFTSFQVLYGGLFLTQLADHAHFNTLSQYAYQLILIVWLAWFCRDFIAKDTFDISKTERQIVKNTFAVWAFLNGILAIVISLAHIHLLGRIRG
ncbi:hypothetical protein, partial [Staphylococcus aureus]